VTKRKRTERKALRKNQLRRDASVGTGQRKIESVFGLPQGSVRLVNPGGKNARIDKSIEALLTDWGWWSD